MSVVASESNRVLVFGVDDVEAPDEVDPLDEVQSSISDQSKSITSAKSEDLEGRGRAIRRRFLVWQLVLPLFLCVALIPTNFSLLSVTCFQRLALSGFSGDDRWQLVTKHRAVCERRQ